jgi:glucosamine--fructose-6-phosphate aminotransferase (isomerizing)
MCGITACVGTDRTLSTLLDGLRNLEYRGYDSAGVALRTPSGVDVAKCSGQVSDLATLLSERDGLAGRIGIGHTRWSTHGPPTDANAHPHVDCRETLAAVHNGIIENHEQLRSRLTAAGHVFESETDTEVIVHLVEEYAERMPVDDAFRAAVEELSGSFAIALVHEDSDAVYATRRGSPLVFGIDDDAYYLASDVPAFLEHTDRVVYLEDGDVLRASPEGYEVTALDGTVIDRPVESVDWDAEEVEKGRFDHYMLKEINEQPTALSQAIHGRVDADAGSVSFDSLDDRTLSGVERLQFVACGTSYHAALYGAQLCRDRGIPARAYLASEYAIDSQPPQSGTLLVGVTQSGETADTLAALRHGRDEGLPTLAVTNVVGSTAARECDDAVYIRAGPEIGVAATKTFSSQVATLTLLAEYAAARRHAEWQPDRELHTGLEQLPAQVATVLEDGRTADIADLAARYRGSDAYFFVGRSTGYPVALEGALKLKEIS